MPRPPAQQNKLFLFAAMGAAALFAVSWASGFQAGIGPGVIGAMVLLALYWRRHPTLRVITLTLWLCVSTGAGLFWPQYFRTWNGFDLNGINLYLVQTIMFCMGATLSVADFTSALRMPKAVLVGMILQFSVMPGVGWFLAESFGFAPDVAAGIILVGSCSGGVSSNLMVYLARGNVALSVTMTACSSLLAPLMTPLLMTTSAQPSSFRLSPGAARSFTWIAMIRLPCCSSHCFGSALPRAIQAISLRSMVRGS